MTGILEYKGLTDSLRDVDSSKREIVGKFADYTSPDMLGDVCHKGMFDRTWKETKSRIRHLYEHDTSKQIGKIIDVWDDDNGAYYRTKVTKLKIGDEILEKALEGLINEHSFGYIVQKGRKNKHGGRDLFEVIHTEVTTMDGGWAMHGNTPLLVVNKSLPINTLEELQKTMDAKHKALSNYCYKSIASDETLAEAEEKMSLLLLEIKQLQQTIIDLKANSTPVAEEAPVSQKGVKPEELVGLNLTIQTSLFKLQNL